MREKVPIDTDELEDESELLDAELRHQIAEGYEASLRGETKDLETLIAELRNELKPESGRAIDASAVPGLLRHRHSNVIRKTKHAKPRMC